MKTGILSSILFLLCAMVLFSCQEKTQYFETAGSLHTPYHIKYSYTKALDKEIQEALKGYITPSIPSTPPPSYRR